MFNNIRCSAKTLSLLTLPTPNGFPLYEGMITRKNPELVETSGFNYINSLKEIRSCTHCKSDTEKAKDGLSIKVIRAEKM